MRLLREGERLGSSTRMESCSETVVWVSFLFNGETQSEMYRLGVRKTKTFSSYCTCVLTEIGKLGLD